MKLLTTTLLTLTNQIILVDEDLEKYFLQGSPLELEHFQ